MDYRSIYEKATGVVLPLSFDVHHIDGNRDNNDIMNLVALPKELHHQYHQTSTFLRDGYFERLIGQCPPMGRAYNITLIKEQVKAVEIWEKCQRWVDHRNYLLKLFPNIHNYDYECRTDI